MTKNNNKQPEIEWSGSDSVSPAVILRQVIANFNKLIQPRLTVLFENIDDTLFDLAEKADSNQNQNLYFESMREVRSQRSHISNEFVKTLDKIYNSFEKKNFDYFKNHENYNKDTKTLNLELVEETELDEALAKSNLIHKSEMAYHRQIFAFEKRFSYLLDTQVDKNSIPIAPYNLVQAFADSLKILDKNEIDIKIKLIIFKIFERSIMGNLTDIYTQINEYLASKGIIKDIKYNVSALNHNHKLTGNHNTTTAAENDNTTDVIHNKNTEFSQESSHRSNAQGHTNIDQNYLLISQLFQQNRHRRANIATSWDNYNAQTIDIDAILMALTALQNDMSADDKPENAEPLQIKKQLIDKLHLLKSETKRQNVLEYDEETIDMIGMLFQFMVEDKNIPSKIQVLLVKLQIPFLKIALRDRKLFADKSHYARVFLEKLSNESIGWSEDSDKELELLKQIKTSIKQVLKLNRYSEAQFKTIQDEFDEFTEKMNKKSKISQKRIQEKELGKEKIRFAKSSVANLLAAKMTNKQIPILIRDILLNEWSNVLVLLALRHSIDSQDYGEKAEFVDHLIDFTQSGSVREDGTMNSLLDSYRSGLKLVAFSPNDLEDKMKLLHECLSNKGTTHSEEAEVLDDFNEPEIPESKNQDAENTSARTPGEEEEYPQIDDEYSKIVSNLRVGTWMEFARLDQSSIRAKLSWISPLSGKYLFVNSRGLKITDKSHLALAAGLRDKSIRILSKTAIFDRALSAIAGRLKKTLA